MPRNIRAACDILGGEPRTSRFKPRFKIKHKSRLALLEAEAQAAEREERQADMEVESCGAQICLAHEALMKARDRYTAAKQEWRKKASISSKAREKVNEILRQRVDIKELLDKVSDSLRKNKRRMVSPSLSAETKQFIHRGRHEKH